MPEYFEYDLDSDKGEIVREIIKLMKQKGCTTAEMILILAISTVECSFEIK